MTFYTRFLDFQLSERFARTALLVSSQSDQHYQLALEEGQPCTGAVLGFGVETATDFEAIERFMGTEGQLLTREDRGWAWVLSLKDPDGYRVELILDRRQQPDGQPFWRGRSVPMER